MALILPMVGRSQPWVYDNYQAGFFPLASKELPAAIYTDKEDFSLVQYVAGALQKDIQLVSGIELPLQQGKPAQKNCVIIGSIDKSSLIRNLESLHKLDTRGIRGKWEAFQIQCIDHPWPGVDKALVVAGSDRRAVAFGVFELSRQIGVSPWYWWADVQVKHRNAIYLDPAFHMLDSPRVKYRGIFINDEAPALSGWTREKFGGFNHVFYAKVFELILRLKANYLWPAMWGNAFYDDDSLSKNTADTFGIVIGTSHHEPLLRAHDEWRRYGKGPWNYDSNAAVLRQFWERGMQRAKGTETIVSVGMRGDGDKPMTQGTAIALLERIVADQRTIIEKVTGRPAEETPQLWALYKEVQDYYDQGMRVPDDITLLLCDDNWGNIRKLPQRQAKPRKGGYGIYYHFDYVGDPRNYKWINTNNIARVWEQMHLAYTYGVDRIWIVNVGDIKPMEFPISFFLDYAWNPNQIHEDNLESYFTQWASEQFGPLHAKEIGRLIQQYSQFNARRKPELLSPETYSLVNYSEFPRVVQDYLQLFDDARHIGEQLPSAYQDAYFELVLHPIEASSNLYAMYLASAKNRFYAAREDPRANAYADTVRLLFARDSVISAYYNQRLANGKWNHMMDQTHIGYTYWQQPAVNTMPELHFVKSTALGSASSYAWPPVISPVAQAAGKSGGFKFVEKDGCVSMLAAHFSRATDGEAIQWKKIPGIGRTGDGLFTIPVDAPDQPLSAASPHVEYDLEVKDSGDVKIYCYFSPTLNFLDSKTGLVYGISVDEAPPQQVSINLEDRNPKVWGEWVANNIIIRSTNHLLARPGKHVIKYWMVSSGVVLQKLVMDLGGMKPSYLGPPETRAD